MVVVVVFPSHTDRPMHAGQEGPHDHHPVESDADVMCVVVVLKPGIMMLCTLGM